jgi:hypothetical protein
MSAGRERGIIFQGWGVRAIREGRKTQTRRVIRNPGRLDGLMLKGEAAEWCPYGRPGDLLVLKSTWAAPKEYDRIKPSKLRRDVRVWTLFDGELKPEWCGRSRPARFIPKWLYPRFPKARLTEVRVQRVQEIATIDILCEGAPTEPGWYVEDAQRWFSSLWDEINGLRPGCSWEGNPWVWALSFELLPAGSGT